MRVKLRCKGEGDGGNEKKIAEEMKKKRRRKDGPHRAVR